MVIDYDQLLAKRLIQSLGLAEFQRTLVRGDLASEYENELRVWLEELD